VIAGLALLSYLIGSVPVAWALTWAVTKRDLRRLGSGNVGVMNVAVSVGRWAGLIVFVSEACKGVAAVAVARGFGGTESQLGVAALAVVAGTRWPIWLGGTGGRGNTAGAAALALISWPSLAAFVAIWAAARLISGSHFTATRASFLAWPPIFGLVSASWALALFSGAICAIYLSMHQQKTDDHLLLKQRWPSLWAFLRAPARGRHSALDGK
jgi:glycerol-3-phosphate acyltransferase PlsY